MPKILHCLVVLALAAAASTASAQRSPKQPPLPSMVVVDASGKTVGRLGPLNATSFSRTLGVYMLVEGQVVAAPLSAGYAPGASVADPSSLYFANGGQAYFEDSSCLGTPYIAVGEPFETLGTTYSIVHSSGGSVIMYIASGPTERRVLSWSLSGVVCYQAGPLDSFFAPTTPYDLGSSFPQPLKVR